MVGISGYTHAGGSGDLFAGYGQGRCGDALTNAFGSQARTLNVGVGKQQHELITAIARQQIRLTQFLLRLRDHGFYQFVAGFVTIGVVNGFQTVGIHHDKAEATAVALRQIDRVRTDRYKRAPVKDAGEFVGFGQGLDF